MTHQHQCLQNLRETFGKIIFENGFVVLHAQTESCCACIAEDLATSFKHSEHAHTYDIGYSE